MRRIGRLIVGLVVLASVAGGAFWWFYLRDDAPPRAALPDAPAAATTTTGPGPGEAPAAPDGTWVVRQGEGVFVGYRVLELFAGETVKKTAVGRTPAVDGTMTFDGTQVTAASFTADLTQLGSDQGRRDNALRGRGLQTDTFPEATFTLTEPVDLGSVPVAGAPVAVTAVGDLTLHGVTRPVEIALEARWNGETIDVAGGLPVVMSDYGIDPPSVSGLLTVDGDGEMELQLTFVRA